jgi:signal transduction histidine kinase
MKRRFDRTYYLSITVSILGAGLYAFWLNSLPVGIYYLFPLIELIIVCKRILYPLIVLHIGVFIIANYMLKDLTLNNLIVYVSIFIVIYLYRKKIDEKYEIALLNQELISANKQLKEYADNIEKTAKIKERTRIAQEIHDSIGHGLVALSMHLEYIQQTLDHDKEKVGNSVDKAYTLSLRCLQDLRSAVSILKEDKTENNLKLSIDDMINNIDQCRAKVLLTFDNQAEKVSLDIKNCIYKTIREAVTNSLKNGNANEIQIEVTNNEHKLSVIIKDNGIGCDYVIKSHGLSAIEERAEKLGGTVSFETRQGCGFKLKMEIPTDS